MPLPLVAGVSTGVGGEVGTAVGTAVGVALEEAITDVVKLGRGAHGSHTCVGAGAGAATLGTDLVLVSPPPILGVVLEGVPQSPSIFSKGPLPRWSRESPGLGRRGTEPSTVLQVVEGMFASCMSGSWSYTSLLSAPPVTVIGAQFMYISRLPICEHFCQSVADVRVKERDTYLVKPGPSQCKLAVGKAIGDLELEGLRGVGSRAITLDGMDDLESGGRGGILVQRHADLT